MGKRSHGLHSLQSQKKQSHAAASTHAASGRALPAELGRASDPLQPNILADQMEFLVSHLPRDRRPQ
jgi:hypothetical protein